MPNYRKTSRHPHVTRVKHVSRRRAKRVPRSASLKSFNDDDTLPQLRREALPLRRRPLSHSKSKTTTPLVMVFYFCFFFVLPVAGILETPQIFLPAMSIVVFCFILVLEIMPRVNAVSQFPNLIFVCAFGSTSSIRKLSRSCSSASVRFCFTADILCRRSSAKAPWTSR